MIKYEHKIGSTVGTGVEKRSTKQFQRRNPRSRYVLSYV